MVGSVAFVHNIGGIYNIGDELCCPAAYFDFSAHPGHQVLVVGGGAFNTMGMSHVKRVGPAVALTWATGRSIPLSESGRWPIPVDRATARRTRDAVRLVVRARRRFNIASTRDVDLVGRFFRYVPCPSVFHRVCELPPGAKLGVFLNGNPLTSSDDVDRILDSLRSTLPTAVFGKNSDSVSIFLSKFAECETVVTNSYHIGYWSLLTGRKLRLIGYSSKFLNMLKIFGLSTTKLTLCRKGDPRSLTDALDRCLRKPDDVSVSTPQVIKAEFRERNLQFAAELVRRGLLQVCALKVSSERMGDNHRPGWVA